MIQNKTQHDTTLQDDTHSLTSKTNVPSAHQSTPLPCPLFSSISGARYSGVPQNVFVPPSAPEPNRVDDSKYYC